MIDITKIKKGDVVKTSIGDEFTWATITGFHNDGGLQGRVEQELDNHKKRIGDFIRIDRDDIFDKLERGPCED